MQIGVMEVIAILNLAGTVILTVFVSRIRKLEDDLKAATREVIDERLLAIRERHVAEFEAVQQRLRDGEARFVKLEEKDQRMELAIERHLRTISERLTKIESKLEKE